MAVTFTPDKPEIDFVPDRLEVVPFGQVEAEDRAGKVWDMSAEMKTPSIEISNNFELFNNLEIVDPATSGMGTGRGRPFPLAETFFARPWLAAAEALIPGARRGLLRLADAQIPEPEFTAPDGLADQIEQAPWYKKLPEAGGWTAEKALEFKTLGFLFKAVGLSSLFNTLGSKLASRIAGREMAKIGGKQALLRYGGWNTFRTRVLTSIAKTAPENMAFVATWHSTEAARRGEPIGPAARKGAIWGLGFSVVVPLIAEGAKAGISTKTFEKIALRLQAKFPRLADYLAGKPEQEFIDATLETFKKEAVVAGIEVPSEVTFSKLTPQAQNIIKGLARQYKRAWIKALEQDAASKRYWAAGAEVSKVPKPVEAKVTPTPEQIAKTQRAKVKTLTDKALTELGKAERPREIIEALKTKELGKRAARSAQAAEIAEGEGRLSAALGQLKGPLAEYKNPDFTPLKDTMSKADIDALHDDVWVRPHNPDHFSRLNTAKAWSKVVEGFVPTRGEILLLEKQWGKEFARGLLKKRPLGDRAWDTAADISNFMRTMIAGGDVSVAGRQLRVLGQRYPKEFGEAVKAGLKAYVSEGLAKIMRQDYESSEFHKEAKKYVQFFDPAGTETTPPSERPEWYVSRFPERVPILGHLIRMGNRNYVETMNMFMQSIWDKLRAQDVVNGVEPTKAELALRGKWLMSMSGRPEIGGVVGRRIAPIASGFFFAPRFAVSRFTSPIYLRHLASSDPVAREVGRNTAKAFASFIGTNIAILSLIKLVFGDRATVELDPRSPDWGKAKIGNTRIDLWSGHQQAARFLVQMTLGQYKTQAGKIKETKRLDTIGRFIRGKENPLVSLISDLYKGKTYEGDRPFAPPEGEMRIILEALRVPRLIQGIGKEAYRRMLFMWAQDFIEASANDGWPLGFTAGALSFFGFNTASYEDTAFTKIAKFKDNIAQTEYGVNWEELNEVQQRTLSRTNEQVFTELRLQAKIEGARRDDYDYVGRLIEDEKKAGKIVYKKLKPENRKILDEAGVSLGLSRKIGDWEINEERYKQYQEITAEILDADLSRLQDLSGLPIKIRLLRIESVIQIAKDKAKTKVRRAAR